MPYKDPAKKKEHNARTHAKNPARASGRFKKWVSSNPERYAAHIQRSRQRRTTREQQAPGWPPDLTAPEYQHLNSDVCEYTWMGDCRGPLTVEHRTPLARGGSWFPENLFRVCLGHNKSKGKKTHQEFLTWWGKYKKLGCNVRLTPEFSCI